MTDDLQQLESFAQTMNIIPRELPTVALPGGTVTITDSADALFRLIAQKKEIFERGGTIVRIDQTSETGVSTIKPVKPSAFRSIAEGYAKLVVHKRQGPVAEQMSESTAKALLDSPSATTHLPKLVGLINCPLLVLHEEKLHTVGQGYDPITGLYVTGESADEPETLDQAVAGIKAVAMADLNFQSPSDLSRAVASVLTPALRIGGFIRGSVPIEIVEARESQTGKGYFALRRCAIYGEKPVVVAKQGAGVGGLDEKFASALLQGRPFVLFDNYRGNFDSAYLESFLTAQSAPFSVRVPYAGEQYVDASKFYVQITSNGMNTTEDLANRMSCIRLLKSDDVFVTSGSGTRMLETIVENPSLFIGCVHKILRSWFERGMPKTDESRHSFSSWAQPLDWIVQNFFDLPPLLDGNFEAQRRIQNPDRSFLREIAIQIQKAGRLDTNQSASQIFALCNSVKMHIPALAGKPGEYDGEQGPAMIGKIMKRLFSESATVSIEGFKVQRDEIPQKTAAGNFQRINTYTFSTDGADPE